MLKAVCLDAYVSLHPYVSLYYNQNQFFIGLFTWPSMVTYKMILFLAVTLVKITNR